MVKKSIAEIVRNRVNKIKELHEDVFSRAEMYKNLYRSRMNIDDTYEWDYSLFDPQVFPIIRNYLAKSNPSKTTVQLIARQGQSLEQKQINQDLVNWELGEIRTTDVHARMLFSGYMFGKGYAKDGWKYQPSIEIVEKDEDGNEIRRIVMRDVQNRGDIIYTPFNRLLIPNRNIPVLFEQPYIIELMSLSIGSLEKDNEKREMWSKSFIAKAKKFGGKSKLDYQAEIPDEEDNVSSKMIDLACMRTIDNEVHYVSLGDFWDKDANIDKDNEYYHGHYPYLEFTPFPEDDEFYTASVVEQVADLQIASNELLNQGLTNVRGINNEMYIAGTDAIQTPDWQFVKRPNGIIRVAGDVGQIKQLQQQDNTITTDRMAQSVQMKIERASGISSMYGGGGAGGTQVNQTARGAMVIDKNIDTNIGWLVDLFNDQVVKPEGEHLLELNAQFITEEQTFHITGKKGVSQLVTLKPEDISANFDVFVSSSPAQKQTPASRQASLQNLLTNLNQNAKMMNVSVNTAPVIEALLDAYPEMENVDNVLTTVDEKSIADLNSLSRGQMPEVRWDDLHEPLIQITIVYLSENEQPPEVMPLFEEYIQKHARFIQAKKEASAMSQPIPPQAPPQDALSAMMGGNGDQSIAGQPGADQTYNLGDMGTGNPALQ